MPDPRFHVERPMAQVVTVTIDRPERNNAFDMDTVQAMLRVWGEIEAAGGARVAIIRSALPRSWMAGGDITGMRELTLEEGARFVYAGHELMRTLERSALVVIGAIGGFALGGGTELALACDLRVASTAAVFGQPEVALGLLPGWGGTQRLARVIGESQALDLILTGRRINAEEALSMGLVNRVCAPEQLDEECLELAKSILANAPMAVMRSKRAIKEGLRASLDQGLVIEAEAWLANLSSPDRVEGLSAFLEKRKPKFGGRE